MKRIGLFVLVLCVFATIGLLAQEPTVLKVKVQSANIRSEPDMGSSVIKQVKLGQLLESRQKIGDWYEISVTDEKGAVVSGYINVSVVDVVTAGGAKPAAGGQQAEVKKGGEQGAPTIIIQQQVQQNQANTQTNVQTPPAAEGTGGRGGSGGFKILGGYCLANIKYDETQDTQQFSKYKHSRSGLGGGIGVEFGARIGFEMDVLYLQKGVVFSGTYTDPDSQQSTTFNFSLNLDEISVPVLLKFHILDNPKAPDFYVMGGGEIAYIFQAKSKYTYTVTGQATQTGTKDVKKNFQQIDYGIVLGGGIGIPLGGTHLVIEARYHLGIANLQKSTENDQGITTNSDFKPKSTLLMLVAGFKF